MNNVTPQSIIGRELGCGGVYAQQKTFLCSLECEIEAVMNGGKSLPNWLCEKDGSLRNNGWEYKSAVPLSREKMLEAFQYLHSQLKLVNDQAFSERTSTHVHVNLSCLTFEEGRTMLLLYALFEEFFFALVKPERRDNIHCVPLTETHLPIRYSRDLHTLIMEWSKYTALNLKRLSDLGTMEFRHMHGTKDVAELSRWLHVLENLWKVSQRVKINEASLSDRKVIEEWFELIFFPADRIMALKPNLFDIIRNSLIDVKFSVV